MIVLRQAFIQPQLNFNRSENNLALLQFILMLRTSEHMFWIQSMPRVPYVYLWRPIGWSWLVMPITLYVCIHLGRGYFKARGIKKDSIPDVIEIELTNIPFKSGIV